MYKMKIGSSPMQKIVVVEYPKSGGSWFVTMIGHSLSIPIRDIYVKDENYSQSFDIRKHPWYDSLDELGLTDVCVIKSHEMPESLLHNFKAHYIHMIRDGRDVIVSKYFFEKDFCVQNGILQSFECSMDEYVERTAKEWVDYVVKWSSSNVLSCKYEQLLANPEETLEEIFASMGCSVSSERVTASVIANRKEAFSKTLDKAFRHNTFVRKGISGDWVNHFTERQKAIFKSIAGDLLIKLEYESDMNW